MDAMGSLSPTSKLAQLSMGHIPQEPTFRGKSGLRFVNEKSSRPTTSGNAEYGSLRRINKTKLVSNKNRVYDNRNKGSYTAKSNATYKLKKVGIDAGELCTPMLQLSAKTCQLQLFVWTDQRLATPAGRLITKEACPYGIWTHVTVALYKNTARIYLNGKLDVEATLGDSIYLPEASLLLGRGVLEKKNKNRRK